MSILVLVSHTAVVTSNAASGYVANISMLRLHIGSGSAHACSGPADLVCPRRRERGWLGIGSHWTDEVMRSLGMHELNLCMPEPFLSLSVLILATTRLLTTTR